LGLGVVGSIGAGYMLNIEWKLAGESGASMLARNRGIILIISPHNMLNPITLRHFSHARFNTTPEHQNRHQVAKTVTFACTYYDLYRVLEQKALVISNAVIISKQKATYSLF
jgi:hypothetical protein